MFWYVIPFQELCLFRRFSTDINGDQVWSYFKTLRDFIEISLSCLLHHLDIIWKVCLVHYQSISSQSITFWRCFVINLSLVVITYTAWSFEQYHYNFFYKLSPNVILDFGNWSFCFFLILTTWIYEGLIILMFASNMKFFRFFFMMAWSFLGSFWCSLQ